MDSFDELPDNFDEAYTLFSQLYSSNSDKLNSRTDSGTPLGSDKLLNDQEQQVFSKFLDNVLDDPKSAADSNEIKWLDHHFSISEPASITPESSRDNKSLSSDFYRGFREVGGTYNHNIPHILPGEHPQLVEKPRQSSPYPLVGTVGAGGHIIPAVPLKQEPQYPTNYWNNYQPHQRPVGNHLGHSSHVNHVNQLNNHLHNQLNQPNQVKQEPNSHSEERFSAAKALSTACSAYMQGKSPGPVQSPAQLHQHTHPLPCEPVVDTQIKRRRSESPKPKPVASSPAPAAVQKKKREFLTENQVRLNHINSEKRRRDLISSNFKQMCSLVPSIKDVQTSLPKAVVLQDVYEFILQTAQENKAIRAELSQKGINCTHIPANKLGEKLIETQGSEYN